MVRKGNFESNYRVTTDKAHYIVTLKRLKNTVAGNPRFEARVLNMDYFSGTFAYSRVYRFTGHYMSEYDEARWIAEYYEG